MNNFSLPVLSSITLFLISFFFIFWTASYFEVDIFPLEDRSINYTTFHVYVFDKYVDSVIITLLTVLWFCSSLFGKKRIVSVISYGSLTATALLTNFIELLYVLVLVSIPIITLFLIYNYFSPKKFLQIQTNTLRSFFSLAILGIAVTGAIGITLTFSSNSSLSELMENYAIDIFLLFSSFSPILLFFLVAGSVVKLLKVKTVGELKNKTFRHQIISQKVKRKTKFLFLLFFILLSIFLALLPHQSFINSENELVGADSVDYVKWLNNIVVEDQGELMYKVFVVQNSGTRPLSLLLFSGMLQIFPDNPYQVIDHLPILLSPVLVLAVFFLTRELTSNDNVSLLASFLTVVSFHSLVGIYAGLYANWLALIFGYASIVFLLRFLKRPNWKYYLAFSVLFVLMMLSHVFTWTVLTLVMGIFLIVSFRLKMFERKRVALVFLIIMASVAFDVVKSSMTDASGGIERNVIIASNNSSLLSLDSIWSNLSETSLVYGAGIFGNFLILSLCIYWLLRSNFHKTSNLFIAIFLAIGILPILFGGEIIQSRVFYDIPFQIPAAIGLAYLANQHRGKLLVFAISLWIFIMSIQTIANFI